MPTQRGSSKKKKREPPDPTSSILNKWRAQATFIRFLDGDTQNCAFSNLCAVSLKDAMEHVHDWKVDWDRQLSPEERELVVDDAWRSRLILRPA